MIASGVLVNNFPVREGVLSHHIIDQLMHRLYGSPVVVCCQLQRSEKINGELGDSQRTDGKSRGSGRSPGHECEFQFSHSVKRGPLIGRRQEGRKSDGRLTAPIPQCMIQKTHTIRRMDQECKHCSQFHHTPGKVRLCASVRN